MAKTPGHPGAGRPKGRRGHGGVGPGPGYKPKAVGKGTAHGKNPRTPGSNQSRPPEKPCRATMAAIPWTVVKLLFGWRPAGYKPAAIPWTI